KRTQRVDHVHDPEQADDQPAIARDRWRCLGRCLLDDRSQRAYVSCRFFLLHAGMLVHMGASCPRVRVCGAGDVSRPPSTTCSGGNCEGSRRFAHSSLARRIASAYHDAAMVYDFHTHTFLSDGELSPVELVRRALVNGYKAIALTDHAGLGTVKPVLKQ